MKNQKGFRAKLIAIFVMTALVCVMFVACNAYSSKLQYEINKINAQAQESSYKIANLQVKIHSATNVNNLESRAMEMGLVYPDFEKIITLKSGEETITDLATALRQNSYN